MANRDRTIYARIDRLDSKESLLDTKTMQILSGKVDLSGGSTRRKAAFSLAEGLSIDYQGSRYKLWYGYQGQSDIGAVWVPLGVFIPMNPKQSETNGGYTTSFQGIDKSKLLTDYTLDTAMSWPAGTLVRDIVAQLLALVGETRSNIDSDIGTLGAAFTFEDGTTIGKVMDTLLEGFNDEWFFDANGIATARRRADPTFRQPALYFDDNDPIEITVDLEVDEDSYYNRVTVVAGKTDTDIYRSTAQSQQAIAKAGGRVVSRFFTTESALSQAGTDALAAYYLSNGVKLPFQLSLTNLVVANLEIGDILIRRGRRFQLTSTSIPLGLGVQTIKAGEIT